MPAEKGIKTPIPIEVASTLLVFDPNTNEWYSGWWNIFTEKKDVDLNDGAVVECKKYSRFLLMVSGTADPPPAVLKVQVQFSVDESTFYNYMDEPFHELESDEAGAIAECYSGVCYGNYMRAIVTGGSADVRAILMT